MAMDSNKELAAKLLSEKAVSKRTDEDIAKECGISCRTLRRWKQEKEFHNAVVGNAKNNSVIHLLPLAMKTLEDILNNPTSSDKSKLSASDMILKTAGMYKQDGAIELYTALDEQAVREAQIDHLLIHYGIKKPIITVSAEDVEVLKDEAESSSG